MCCLKGHLRLLVNGGLVVQEFGNESSGPFDLVVGRAMVGSRLHNDKPIRMHQNRLSPRQVRKLQPPVFEPGLVLGSLLVMLNESGLPCLAHSAWLDEVLDQSSHLGELDRVGHDGTQRLEVPVCSLLEARNGESGQYALVSKCFGA